MSIVDRMIIKYINEILEFLPESMRLPKCKKSWVFELLMLDCALTFSMHKSIEDTNDTSFVPLGCPWSMLSVSKVFNS